MSRSIDSIALVVKLTIMGVMRMACPIEMANGVNKSWNIPKGPNRLRSKNRIRPSTTVGIPRKALNDALMKRLPRNFFIPKSTAIGMLHSEAIIVANPDTYSDRKTMSKISGLREKRSWNALIVPSISSVN